MNFNLIKRKVKKERKGNNSKSNKRRYFLSMNKIFVNKNPNSTKKMPMLLLSY